MKKGLILWHTFRIKYYQVSIKDCLNENIKEKLLKKLEYHSEKLNDLQQRQSH